MLISLPPPEQHHDGRGPGLDKDADDAQRAAEEDDLASADHVRDEAGRECGDEDADVGGRVEHLLVVRGNLWPSCGCCAVSVEESRYC